MLLDVGAPTYLANHVQDLILATRHEATPDSPDAELMIDVDLSIFGAKPDRFWEYESQIRMEYEWVPEEAYRSTRAKLLRRFLARPWIYQTPTFADIELQARENLSASLERLEAES